MIEILRPHFKEIINLALNVFCYVAGAVIGGVIGAAVGILILPEVGVACLVIGAVIGIGVVYAKLD